MSLFFLGGTAANGNLTGSATLLEVKSGKKTTKVMIDCGLVQTGFRKSLSANLEILKHVNPADIDCIVATHAHIDHIGRIPLFVKNGFKGRIICTKMTSNLLEVMLMDAAKIQVREAEYRKDRDKKDPQGRVEISGKKEMDIGPLYDFNDVEQARLLVKNDGYDYGDFIKLGKGIKVKFYNSGHILGGASCVFETIVRGKKKYLACTGDLGRNDNVILSPPERIIEPVSFLLSESTYGGSDHPERGEETERLRVLTREAFKNDSKILTPAFACERVQEIVYQLSADMMKNRLPRMNIYIDSPMAIKATEVFANAWRIGVFRNPERINFNPFSKENPFLKFAVSDDDSKDLMLSKGPHIIIASSGMCDFGRIRAHLRSELGNPNTLICLVGYMGKETLGRKLLDGFTIVQMNKQSISVRARIENFHSFSSHADQSALVSYATEIAAAGRLEKIFLNHGDDRNPVLLKEKLMDSLPAGKWLENIIIPRPLEGFELN